MNRAATSGPKRAWLTFVGIGALCVDGVLVLLTQFAPRYVPANLAWTIVIAAAGLLGAISLLATVPMLLGRGMGRLAPRRAGGTGFALGAVQLAFGVFMIWSAFSSSPDIKHAGSAALSFFLALLLWETRGQSRQTGAPN